MGRAVNQRRPLRAIATVLVAFVAAASPVPASAQSDARSTTQAASQNDSVDAALRAYQDGRVEEAERALERALERGESGPETLFTIHRSMGLVQAVMGQQDAARAHFARALAIRPTASTPAELPPQMRALFESLREDATATRIRIEARSPVSRSTTTPIHLEALDAPPGWARQVRVRVGEAGWTTTTSLDDGVEVPIPADAWGPGESWVLFADVLDAHGNVIARARQVVTADAPVASTPSTVPMSSASPETGGGTVFDEAWFWILVGTVVAAAVAIPITLELTADNVFVLGEFTVVE